MNTKTERTPEQIVQSVTVAELLRTAYSLTHTLHRLDAIANDRLTRNTKRGDDARQQGAEVRAQRDLIDAEIERRCAR